MNSKRDTAGMHQTQPDSACPLCGESNASVSWQRLTFKYGTGDSEADLVADVPVRRCSVCDFEYLDEVAEDRKHEAVCRHLRVLSPAEIKEIRAGHDLSRAKFAQLTGLGEASLHRWENSLSIQTHAYDRFLRLLTRPENMEYLRRHAESTGKAKRTLLFQKGSARST